MGFFVRLYTGLFHAIQRALDGWLLGLAARFTFAAVLLVYFWNSAMAKVGSGLEGLLTPSADAYTRILPQQMAAAGADPSRLGDLAHVVVYAATYAELLLPVLVVIGLLTRVAALGMLILVAAMAYSGLTGAGGDIGGLFDGTTDSVIDQRLLWAFPLLFLFLRGPGTISLDFLFGRPFRYDRYDYD